MAVAISKLHVSELGHVGVSKEVFFRRFKLLGRRKSGRTVSSGDDDLLYRRLGPDHVNAEHLRSSHGRLSIDRPRRLAVTGLSGDRRPHLKWPPLLSARAEHAGPAARHPQALLCRHSAVANFALALLEHPAQPGSIDPQRFA